MSTIDDILGDALNDPHIFDFLPPPPPVTPRKLLKKAFYLRVSRFNKVIIPNKGIGGNLKGLIVEPMFMGVIDPAELNNDQ